MKRHNYIALIALGFAALTACDKFLDELPDDRASLTDLGKIKSFLVSSYPQHSPNMMLEYSSDNVMHNGDNYGSRPEQDLLYRWEDNNEDGNDSPRSVWNAHYTAAATANQALEALSEMGHGTEVDALRAEALLCRAYAMFQLANTYCMAWNPEKANEYLGLPYPKRAGESVDERGTLAELYANINADIEEALPMMNDSHLDTPKWHFNTKAGYAFAARFNLYYLNDEKAIEYASKVLGAAPILRNVASYGSLAGSSDIHNAYLKDDTNLMFVASYSLFGRSSSGSYTRYAHNRVMITNETFWARMPWGSGSGNNALHESRLQYGNDYIVLYPKMLEMFEITDKVAQTGYPHIVDPVFTMDETLLVRAEAYVRTKQYDLALKDMNTWITYHCAAQAGTATRPVLTEASVNSFMNSLPEVPAVVERDTQRGVKKPLHPQGFTVEEGTMTNMLYTVLQMRRLETWWQGLRFLDIKRYGIEFSHNLVDMDPLAFTAGDLRGALQLPADAIVAGLEANPRN